MNADTLRRAAAQIRNDRGGVVSRNTEDGRRWLPVADWLDAEAESHRADLVGPFPSQCCRMSQALAVARAYLGESS
ncbi:MAG TPA: hypothetical protein VJ782_02270 [Aeromicrobium sp.]|nr:hypothetical protein [Aeromicrobium sp.]